MKTCAEMRRENAQALAADGPADFAKRLGMPGQQANQIIGPNPTRNIGDAKAREIEEAYEKERGWLDHDHSPQHSFEPLISGQNTPLSDEARELILCVTRLDAAGQISRKTFRLHTGLLSLSAASTELQTGLARSNMLAEADRLLAARLEIPEGSNDREHKK